MSYKAIANLIPTIESTSLVSHNLKSIEKKSKTTKDMLNLGVSNTVGISMIKINADLIGSI